MHKGDIISFDNLDKKDLEICLQEKIIEKSFSKVERSTKVLQLLHFDIC